MENPTTGRPDTPHERAVEAWLQKPLHELMAAVDKIGFDHPYGSPAWLDPIWNARADALGLCRVTGLHL